MLNGPRPTNTPSIYTNFETYLFATLSMEVVFGYVEFVVDYYLDEGKSSVFGLVFVLSFKAALKTDNKNETFYHGNSVW